MKQLSVTKRGAIRHFAESSSPIGVHGGTIKSLIKDGLLDRTADADFNPVTGEPRPAMYALTAKGVRCWRQMQEGGK